MTSLHADFASSLLDPRRAVPAGLKTRPGAVPAHRLDVYRNNVVLSLLEALATTFPVTRKLVGDEFFREMGRRFIRRHPPTSPRLSEFGEMLPAFIADFVAAASVPYLADVARLEFLRVQAFHAADAEPVPAIDFQALLASPDELANLRITLHPSCRWFASRHAVVSLWAAHQGHGELSGLDIGAGEEVLVVRPAFDVLVVTAAPGTGTFLTALARGDRLADAALAATAVESNFDLAAQFSLLIHHGLAVQLHLKD